MIVDSSALAEQVVADVIASAFDSAGQRCSALRVLCLQEDIADRQLAMLRGAMHELVIGNPDRLATDIGPVITAEARDTIEAHVAKMAAAGCRVTRLALPDETAYGTFVAPTIIEIDRIDQLEREVFGPVLHVVRFARKDLARTVQAINATGYGLTFGLHTRLDDTVRDVTAAVGVGNIYVNRNTIGAVVGVQPFGGRGLSGTGPKAGGPLYLTRLIRGGCAADLPTGPVELPGPVGERNIYALHPRGAVLVVPASEAGLAVQMAAVKEAGCTATVLREGEELPHANRWAAALVEQPTPDLLTRIAAMEGPLPLVQAPGADSSYCQAWLCEEVSTSINTTAAGGNASLMALV